MCAVGGQVAHPVVGEWRGSHPVREHIVAGIERHPGAPGRHRLVDIAKRIVAEVLGENAGPAEAAGDVRQVVVAVGTSLRVGSIERVGNDQLPQSAIGIPGRSALTVFVGPVPTL